MHLSCCGHRLPRAKGAPANSRWHSLIKTRENSANSAQRGWRGEGHSKLFLSRTLLLLWKRTASLPPRRCFSRAPHAVESPGGSYHVLTCCAPAPLPQAGCEAQCGGLPGWDPGQRPADDFPPVGDQETGATQVAAPKPGGLPFPRFDTIS